MLTQKHILTSAMLASFALVQLADIATTRVILQRGGVEANPLMAWAQGSLGSAWMAPKLALAAIALCLLPRFRKPWHIAVAVVACAIPVISNLVVLATWQTS